MRHQQVSDPLTEIKNQSEMRTLKGGDEYHNNG